MTNRPEIDNAGQEVNTPPQEICRGALCIAEVLSDVDAWTLKASSFDGQIKHWMLERESPNLMLTLVQDLKQDTWLLKGGWVEGAFWMTDEEEKYVFDAAMPLIDKVKRDFAASMA